MGNSEIRMMKRAAFRSFLRVCFSAFVSPRLFLRVCFSLKCPRGPRVTRPTLQTVPPHALLVTAAARCIIMSDKVFW